MTEPSTTPGSSGGLPGSRAGTDGPNVVLVHGFTQTRASWNPVTEDLGRDHQVLVVDAPGHGEAGELRADLATGARLLIDAGGHAVYVGYSMGGRLALRAALDRPDLVSGLVLLGATAGIDNPNERAARQVADEAMAGRIEAEGVAPFLTGWLDQQLFTDLDVDPVDRAARLANTAAGLASSLRLAGTGTMDPPWWDELGRCQVPTLVVAGGRDQKFTALGCRLAEGLGGPSRFTSLPDVGHAAHLQRPQTFAALVRQFTASGPDSVGADPSA